MDEWEGVDCVKGLAYLDESEGMGVTVGVYCVI